MSKTEAGPEQGGLSQRLTRALLTPIMLLIVVGAVLGLQVSRMNSDAQWVDHTDEVVGVANLAHREIIDQESGLRGYLLTSDRTFLEPYANARPIERLRALRGLVADNPPQLARLDDLIRRYEWWHSDAELAVAAADLTPFRTMDGLRERRGRMDAVRATLREVTDAEGVLRRERVLAAQSSAMLTRYTLAGLTVLAAFTIAFLSRRQLSEIAQIFRDALEGEREARVVAEAESWVRAGMARLVDALQGDLTLTQASARAAEVLAELSDAAVAVVFTQGVGEWKRRAAYGIDQRDGGAETFATGEGLVGRVGVERKLVHVKELPASYLLKVRSGSGETAPVELVLVPASVDRATFAVVELAFLQPPAPRALALLERVGESIGMAIRSAEYKQNLRDLLEESQRQAEELQTQQEELRVANEELQEQSEAVRAAQAQLEEQQHELEATNVQLEEQARTLTDTQQAVLDKAAEAEQSSRYKSEFLANMSHELRTPLNSTLILARLLGENKEGNLTAEQRKYAETIYSSGNDLLTLINDILDLSKIEAGRVELSLAKVPVGRLTEMMSRTFEHVAKEKGLRFEVKVSPSAPDTLTTDAQRVEQILKNLLANALKFTAQGEVALSVEPQGDSLRFAVRDTGIGVAEHQRDSIFDAFRQADGTTVRKYGGTGLGLTISRELARLLGGSIELESTLGKGSVFTLVLPRVTEARAAESHAEPARTARNSIAPLNAPPRRTESGPVKAVAQDDRQALDRAQRLVLVVEDDVPFAEILVDLAHELGFQCVVAHGANEGVALVRKHRPTAVLLDLGLPDHSGLSVLDRLKRDPLTRHIPVHVISSQDDPADALSMGAIGYLRKPVQRDDLVDVFRKLEGRIDARVRRVLVVEDDAVQRDAVAKLLGGPDVELTGVGTVAEAFAALQERSFDCVITDLSLPDQSGFELLERMAGSEAYSFPPVIVYTGRSLTADEEQKLRRYSSSIIVKGARSPARLLDQVTLFLHQVESELPPERRRILEHARDREAVFEGKRILVVEDDVRNIYALSSVLEHTGARVLIARNGREALEQMDKHPDVDLVLMDIMMPEMDGLQATRELRKQSRFAKLPIIALTAKAMKDDQERCLQAGVNDYIPKPLDSEMLLSLLRVWMPR